MANLEIIPLAAPVGGLRRDTGYQQKEPYYTEDCLNVRPFDVIEGRGRIGSRPGLAKAFPAQIGTGSPVRLSSVIRTFNSTGSTSFLDNFDAALSPGSWTQATWAAALPVAAAGTVTQPSGVSQLEGAILTGISNVSTAAYRSVTLVIAWIQVAYTGYYQEISLLLDTRNNSNGLNEGIRAVLRYPSPSGTDYGLTLYVDGVVPTEGIAVASFGLNQPPNVLNVTIDSSKAITVNFYKYGQSPVKRIEHTAVDYTPTYSQAGFSLINGPGSRANLQIDSFSFGYTPTGGGIPPEAAVFSSGGKFYRETTSGTLTELTPTPSDLTLASDTHLHAVQRLEKLFIADYGVIRERLTGSTAATITHTDSTHSILDDSDVTDWSTVSIDKEDHVLEIIQATRTSDLVDMSGVYEITNVKDTAPSKGVTFLHAARVSTDYTSAAATPVAYRILRYPKVYDAAAGTLTRVTLGVRVCEPTIAARVNQFPAGCRSITLWADRLVMCNNKAAPHGWWMSRAGYPFIWDYADTGRYKADGSEGVLGTTGIAAGGVSAAVPGFSSEFAGLLGEPIITTIPINDDLLVFACKTSFYYLRGNPLAGGQHNNITKDVGIVDIGAWCRTSEGRLIVLTPDGLYEITTERAIPLSRDVVPQELLGLTDDHYDVCLGYDVARRGVIVAASSKDPNLTSVYPSVNYFYDVRLGGFFPDSRDPTRDAMSAVSYQPGGIGSPVMLWGCRDGYVRRFDDGAVNDDGKTYDSYCLYGPLRLGSSEYDEGILHELVGVVDANGNEVLVDVRTGYSAQVAKGKSPRFVCTLAPGRNRTRYPRLRGGAAYIKVAGVGCTRWAMESLTVTRERTGKLRVT